jgi:hypothetical protein
MKKTILAAVSLAVLALAIPSAAEAKRAVTYTAKLAPTSGSSVRGKASLVDGKRRDKLQLHVKGLEAGATYTWSLRRAATGGDACSGDAVGFFAYSSLEGRRGGNAKVRSRAKGFSGGSGAYAVVISDAEGGDVACLELKNKAQRKTDRKADAKHRHDAGDDDTAGDEVHFDEDDELGEGDSSGGDDSADDDSADDESSDDDPVDGDVGASADESTLEG